MESFWKKFNNIPIFSHGSSYILNLSIFITNFPVTFTTIWQVFIAWQILIELFALLTYKSQQLELIDNPSLMLLRAYVAYISNKIPLSIFDVNKEIVLVRINQYSQLVYCLHNLFLLYTYCTNVILFLWHIFLS